VISSSVDVDLDVVVDLDLNVDLNLVATVDGRGHQRSPAKTLAST